METAQRKDSSIHPSGFPGQPGSKPLNHTSRATVNAHRGCQESVWPMQGEDGKLEEL